MRQRNTKNRQTEGKKDSKWGWKKNRWTQKEREKVSEKTGRERKREN